jgi:hypothetical protein
MKNKPDADRNYVSPTSLHYNIRCVGGVIFNRVSARYFKELRPDVIEWAYCVAQKRELSNKEVASLCKAK